MKSGRIALTVVLLLIGLVAVNYLASALPVRVDATADRIYTLSPGTRAILGQLEEPVQLDFYFSSDAAGLRVSDKNYAERVREMLRQYVRAAQGKLQLNLIDPKPDTPAEEQAAAAGLTGRPLPTGETVYFGLVATHADKREVIPFFTPEREPFLEYDLSRAIHAVQLFERPKVGLLTSLPLRAQPDFMAMQMGRMPQDQLIVAEWQRSFELVPVEPSATSLPTGLDALVIVHPPQLPDALQYAIDQFVLGGKPVFLAVDPSSRAMAERSRQTAMMGAPASGLSSDLSRLLGAWGIAYDPNHVVADLANAMQVSTGAGRVERFPHWIGFTREDLNLTAPATSQLKTLLFVEAGAIAPKDGLKDVTFTPLVQTSDQSGTLPAATLQFGFSENVGGQVKASGRKTVAALVQGKFRSAFPDGAPKADAQAPADANAAPEPPAALKESTGSSTVVVVTDADWLMDAYSVRRMAFLGMQAFEPLNDNLAFASNAVEFLAGSQDLISIRGKGASQRPFTVVRRMEAAAQQRYQERLDALEGRLHEVQTRLTELQGKKTEGNRLVATPEVAKAIEDFQTQQLAIRSERRQIRAALRADIEQLEYTLVALNLLLPMVLVAVFGLAYARHRRAAAI